MISETNMSAFLPGHKLELSGVKGELTASVLKLELRVFLKRNRLVELPLAEISKITVTRKLGIDVLTVYTVASNQVVAFQSKNPAQWVTAFREVGVQVDGETPRSPVNPALHLGFSIFQFAVLAILGVILIALTVLLARL